MPIRLAAPFALAFAVVLVAGCMKDAGSGAAQDTAGGSAQNVTDGTVVDLTAGNDKNHVRIVMACQPPRGANFRLAPWVAEMESRAVSIGWTLIGGQTDGVTRVVISPADPTGAWPFVSKAIAVPSDRTVWVKNPQGPGATYKYKITGICVRGGSVEDTVIVDPDLIIPN